MGRRILRWLVLVFMSLVCFAQYYIYDSITPLGTLIKKQLVFSGEQYGLLFSAYSAANVFLLMLLIAGILVDRWGLKRSGILYGFLCFVGAALTALGAWGGMPHLLGPLYDWLGSAFLPGWSAELKVMLLGRLIYGVGAEAILVVNNKVLARWFKGHELAFAYGLNLTVMRLGTYLALTVQAPVATRWSLQTALWFATGVMGVGFLMFFVYLMLERIGARDAPNTSQGLAADEEFHLRDAFSFDASFWYITFLCVTFYSAVFPFQAYAPDMLVNKFGYSESLAGIVTGMLILGTMIFTPIFGWFVDHKGRRATLMLWGSLMLIPCHLVLGLTHVLPAIPIFVVGIALSLVPAALWAAIPVMVAERRLGTAFGIVGYVQNVGLMLFPWLAGKVADANTVWRTTGEQRVAESVDYTWVMVMFAALGIVGFAFSILLKRADARRPAGRPSIEDVVLEEE